MNSCVSKPEEAKSFKDRQVEAALYFDEREMQKYKVRKWKLRN